jgi:hypothetical protein
LNDINTTEYWSVNKISGGSASLTLNWDNSKVPFPNWVLSDIRTAYYNGSNWIDVGGTASGNVTTTGTITSNSVSAFGNFTFGSLTFPLPLLIINFTAQRFNTSIQINWITANEENVNHFEVERSDDGLSFYSLSTVPARNRSITEYYFTNDNVVIHDIVYYRLKCIDNDGKTKFSKIVRIKENTISKDLKLVMNPLHDQIVLSASEALSGSFNYKLKTSTGALVREDFLSIQNGGIYSIKLPSTIASGIYLLEVSNLKSKFSFRVVIN